MLLGAALIALERMGVLPATVATTVHQAERWLEPMLEELGFDLPPRADDVAPPVPSPSSVPGDQAAARQALALLDRISVVPERGTGYGREDWPHWLDQDGDCMNARHEVLLAESLVPTRRSVDGCDVDGGQWRDVYTGEAFHDPSGLDVDHLVPLAEAHRSGGYAWDRDRRAAYANDLGDARTLIAVSASANRSKGDKGPEEWLPPRAAARCHYVADWVAVKVRWSLSMDERERVTVGNLLSECAGS